MRRTGVVVKSKTRLHHHGRSQNEIEPVIRSQHLLERIVHVAGGFLVPVLAGPHGQYIFHRHGELSPVSFRSLVFREIVEHPGGNVLHLLVIERDAVQGGDKTLRYRIDVVERFRSVRIPVGLKNDRAVPDNEKRMEADSIKVPGRNCRKEFFRTESDALGRRPLPFIGRPVGPLNVLRAGYTEHKKG